MKAFRLIMPRDSYYINKGIKAILSRNDKDRRDLLLSCIPAQHFSYYRNEILHKISQILSILKYPDPD